MLSLRDPSDEAKQPQKNVGFIGDGNIGIFDRTHHRKIVDLVSDPNSLSRTLAVTAPQTHPRP